MSHGLIRATLVTSHPSIGFISESRLVISREAVICPLFDQEGAMKNRFWMYCLGLAPMLTALAGAPAVADETVSISGPLGIGDSRAVLIKPQAPRASVILMPGGDGSIRAGDQGDIHGLTGNQLVRTRHAYADLGLAVLVVDASTDLGSAVEYMAAIQRPVTVIATSAGTIRAAQGIWRGARPDALVLTSGLSVQNRAAAMTR